MSQPQVLDANELGLGMLPDFMEEDEVGGEDETVAVVLEDDGSDEFDIPPTGRILAPRPAKVDAPPQAPPQTTTNNAPHILTHTTS